MHIKKTINKILKNILQIIMIISNIIQIKRIRVFYNIQTKVKNENNINLNYEKRIVSYPNGEQYDGEFLNE